MAKDIEGNEIKIGDTVYYARKNKHAINEILICEVTNIMNGHIKLGKYLSTNPSWQIAIKTSIREKKLNRIVDAEETDTEN